MSKEKINGRFVVTDTEIGSVLPSCKGELKELNVTVLVRKIVVKNAKSRRAMPGVDVNLSSEGKQEGMCVNMSLSLF